MHSDMVKIEIQADDGPKVAYRAVRRSQDEGIFEIVDAQGHPTPQAIQIEEQGRTEVVHFPGLFFPGPAVEGADVFTYVPGGAPEDRRLIGRLLGMS